MHTRTQLLQTLNQDHMMNMGKKGHKAQERKGQGAMGSSTSVYSTAMETDQVVGLW